MPNPYVQKALGKTGSRKRRRPTLPELRQREAELTAQAAAEGARTTEQESPGVFRTLIDILSRPNYAIAGFFDEVLQGKSVTSGVGRAFNEFFSGIPGFQGQKEAWGQVLEQAGVGTKTLADVFPMLEDTWVGGMGSRGAAGLALDIFTDPLTYITAGTNIGRTIILKGSKVGLTKTGMTKYVETINKAIDNLGDLGQTFRKPKNIDEAIDLLSADALGADLVRRNSLRKAMDVAKHGTKGEGGFARLLAENPDWVDKGGLKFFGHAIPGTPRMTTRFAEYVGPKVANAVGRLPNGQGIKESATRFGDGLGGIIRGLFHPFEKLSSLPKAQRLEAMDLHRAFTRANTIHKSRLMSVATPIVREFERLGGKNIDELGKRLHDVMGKVPGAALKNAEEKKLFDAFDALYKSMYKTSKEAGTLEEGLENYFSHFYKNSDEFSEIWARYTGQLPDASLPKHAKHRVFKSYHDAVKISEELNRISLHLKKQGLNVRVYPVLEPNYNMADNLGKYIEAHSNALTKKAWIEEASAKFGKEVKDALTKRDLSAAYDLGKIHLPEAEAKAIDDWLRPNRWSGPGKGSIQMDSDLMHQKFMGTLSEDGKREFMRRIFMRSTSISDIHNLETMAGWKQFAEYLPRRLSRWDEPITKGMEHLGDNVVRTGAFWGEKAISIPRQIADDIENINSKLLNSKEYQGFGKLLQGFDKVNNWFKFGVYTLWPASMARDSYSNIALSFLDIGVHAMSPGLYRHSIGILGRAEGGMELFGRTWSYKELRNMAEDYGVYVPGEVFAEQTGRQIGAGAFQKGTGRAAKKLMRARGEIENSARVSLWVQNMRRGLDPQSASSKVDEFLFNYGELSGVEKEVFKRLIPFYTFTRKNIELQVKALARTPGRVINQLKPFRGRTDENESMVKWEAEALKMRLDRDGKTVHVLTGIDLPLRNLDTLWPGTAGGAGRRILGMLTPVLKTPLEAIAGRDFFTGGDLKRTSGPALGRFIELAHTPQPVKDWLGYKKEYDDAGRPRYSFDGTRYAMLVRSWMFSRAVSTSDRMFREYISDDDTKWNAALLDFLTGIRVKEINLNEQQKRRIGNHIRQLEEARVRRGGMKEFSKAFEDKKRRFEL